MSEDIVVDEVQVGLEKEARQFGWVPLEEFRGDESSWADAESFVKRGKEINPILRKNNERLLRELESTKKQMTEFKEAADEFKKFQRDSYERKAADLQTELTRLKEQKKDAIRSGDGDLAVDLEEQIDSVKELHAEEKRKAVEPEKQAAPETSPEVDEWLSGNEWYSKDARMRSATDAIGAQLSKEQPWLRGKAFFESLDKELEATFSAEKLGKRIRPRSPVESSSTSTTRSSGGGKGYASLPSEAKSACDKFVRQGLMTQAEYVNSYEW
jgi:hypothetical protein